MEKQLLSWHEYNCGNPGWQTPLQLVRRHHHHPHHLIVVVVV